MQIQGEVLTTSRAKSEELLQKPKRSAEIGKDNQPFLKSTPRPHKSGKKVTSAEKRSNASSKTNLHSTTTLKSTDSSCLPQEYRFL